MRDSAIMIAFDSGYDRPSHTLVFDLKMNDIARMLWKLKTIVLLSCANAAFGQNNPATLAVRKWREANEGAIVREFSKLLSIPNLASDAPNIRKNAAAVQQLLEQ